MRGHPRPETLKVIVCFAGGWLGEGEISYAGPNAEARARLAAEIVRRRVGDGLALRCDLIGVLSVFGDDAGRAHGRRPPGDARDVRLRVAAAHPDRARVEDLLREVTALYTCGPAGGGGVRTAITPRLHSASCFVPRDLVPATFTFWRSDGQRRHPRSAAPHRPRPRRRQGRHRQHQRDRLPPRVFPLLVEQVTEDRVAEVFRDRAPAAVRRYVLPKLRALNFVLEGVLDGGVNESLGLDTHGKTLAFLLLGLEVEVPAELAGSLALGNRSRPMLALLGLLTIVVLLAAIISKRMSPLVALIAVPVVAALVGGFGLDTGKFIVRGIRDVAPVAGMFIFAILYFGIVTDAGLLDPVIDRILRAVGTRPRAIVVGTALLALVVHLDGSGAVTFLITIPAMLPLYERLGMDRRVLACAASLAAGVNFLPWTGPTVRASAALEIPVAELFNPLIPVQAVGLLYVFAVAYWLGRREEKRLGLTGGVVAEQFVRRDLSEEEKGLRRPRNFWPNLVLTLLLMAGMVSGKVEPVVLFMLGTVLALLLNYPHADQQRARVDAHARPALMMAGILLAAGAFTGIMKESGMLGGDGPGRRRPPSARVRRDTFRSPWG